MESETQENDRGLSGRFLVCIGFYGLFLERQDVAYGVNRSHGAGASVIA